MIISIRSSLSRIILLLWLFAWVQLSSAQDYRIHFASQKSGNTVIENSFESSRYTFSFEGLHVMEVQTEAGTFSELILPKGHHVGDVGSPKLPAMNHLIEVPYGAEVTVRVNKYHIQEFSLSEYGILHPLMPVQPPVPKTHDPGDLPFFFSGDRYEKSGYIEPEIAAVEVLGSLRGVRLARITLSPISYNPLAGTIRVYNDLEIEVQYHGASLSEMAAIQTATYSPYFDGIYNQLLSSFRNQSLMKSNPDIQNHPIRMIIVSHADFQQTLQPFIRWQIEKGYDVEVRYFPNGVSSSEVRNYISGEYHTGTPEKPAPTFLVIVGDVSKIPASSVGISTGVVTDLYYASVDDQNGYFPDMYYGRLSARNTQELQNQIDKIIYYQQYQFEDASFLNDVTLIAGASNLEDWNQLILQPTVLYGEQNYFNAANGFANVNMYLSNYQGLYEAEKVSASLITFTGHCSPTTWHDPLLTPASVHQMTNFGKYPLVIGNCCQSALFNQQESIGEAWVRAQNRGAIAYIGSAPDTHWFEDFYWTVGAFPMQPNNAGGYIPKKEETTTGVFDAPFAIDYLPVGGFQFIGNLSVTEAHSRGFMSLSNTRWYWEGYHTFGDPSTFIYFREATENQIEHIPVIPVGQNYLTIKALPGSYAAISASGVLHGAGFVNETGTVQLKVYELSEKEKIKIVVTKPQHIPYIREIPAMTLSDAYVVVDSYSINDPEGNNNRKADYGETVALDISLKNIGSQSVEQVHAWLQTNDEFVSVLNPDEPVVFTGLKSPAGKDVSSVSDAFQVSISKNVPNNHQVKFTLTVSDGTNNWESWFSMPVYAPVLWIDPDFFVADGFPGNNNGRLDPGETINLGFRIHNKGGAQANDPMVLLQTSSPFLTAKTESVDLSILNPGDMRVASFLVHANASTQEGIGVPLSITAVDGYSNRLETSITIGQAPEISIGKNNITSNQFPFYNLYKSNRTQMIYLANELGAGEKIIKQIGFEIIQASTSNNHFRNFTIRMKHTDFPQFPNNFLPTHDATVVFYSSGYLMPTSPGWHHWNINEFQYDGKRNILVEISWGLNSGWTTPFYRVASTELNRNRTAFGTSDTHTNAPFSGVSPVRPNIFLAFNTPPPKELYGITFMTINSIGQPIESANVKIGSRIQHINPAGITTYFLYPGKYQYQLNIENELRSVIVDSLWVQNSANTLVFKFYDVMFNPKNAKSEELIADAMISVNGREFQPGEYLLKHLPPGNFQYTISRIGYHDLNGTFNIADHDMNIDLMLVPDTTVSTNDHSAKQAGILKIFPNPANHEVSILLPPSDSESRIELLNQHGQVVRSYSTGIIHHGETIRLNLNGVSAGMYFIRVRQDGSVMTEKLIVF